jgi:hypothetical protein
MFISRSVPALSFFPDWNIKHVAIMALVPGRNWTLKVETWDNTALYPKIGFPEFQWLNGVSWGIRVYFFLVLDLHTNPAYVMYLSFVGRWWRCKTVPFHFYVLCSIMVLAAFVGDVGSVGATKNCQHNGNGPRFKISKLKIQVCKRSPLKVSIV